MGSQSARTESWLDDLAEGVVLIERGRIARVNRAAAEMLGVDARWAAGQSLILVLRDARLERVWIEKEAVELAVQGRRLEVAPIAGGISLRDVSRVHEAQENARELLAVLSHELRTPMTTVRSTLEALEYEDLPDSSRKRLLARAVDEANRVVRLLGDLTVDLDPQRERSVSLRSVIERANGIVAATLADRNVELRARVNQMTVWADPDKVLQVLINLIENAAAYGPRGAPVDVECMEMGNWGLILVRDRGPALTEEVFAKLFEPFKRGTSASGRGEGLGLYIVRSIAERWGGYAWGRGWRPKGAVEPVGNEFGVLIPLNSYARQRGAPEVDLANLDAAFGSSEIEKSEAAPNAPYGADEAGSDDSSGDSPADGSRITTEPLASRR